MNQRSRELISYLWLFLSQAMVGVCIVGSKYLLVKMPIFVLLEVRFAFATLILFLLDQAFFVRKTKPNYSLLNKGDWLTIFFKSLFAGFLFNLFIILGLQRTSANVAGIITSALPAVIAIMSLIFLKEKLSKGKWICILFATVGLIIINTSKIDIGGFHSSLLGDLFILIALLPEAGYYILSKAHKNKLPVMTVSTWINGISAVLFIPFAWFSMRGAHLDVSLFDWIVTLLVGLGSGLFYVFWYYGSESIPGSTAALFTATMPINTLILAWLFLGEGLNSFQFAGMVFILASILFSTRIAPKELQQI